MKSPAAAMTWELVARDRWWLLNALLGTLVVPIAIFTMLRQVGVSPDEKPMRAIYVVLLEAHIFTFGLLLFVKQWNLASLYTRPISTASMVAWRLGPSMALMAFQAAGWALVLNWLFGLHWPVGGPAMYAATTFAAAAATAWLLGASRWNIFALTLVGAIAALWLKSRFGPMFDDPRHMWEAVTLGEGLTMLATGSLAFWVAVIGVARGRRGERPFSLGLVALLTRLFDRPAARHGAYRTAAQAQRWYVWRNGGGTTAVMPILLLMFGVLAFGIWLFSGKSATELLEIALAGRVVILIMALITGAAMGEISSGKVMTISQFLATRPIPSTAIARATLVGGAVILAGLWLMWAAAVGAAALLVWDTPAVLGKWLPGVSTWQEIPGAIVASWILLGLGATMLLSGRTALVVKIFLAAISLWITFAVVAKLTLTPEVQATCERIVASCFGVVCVLSTAWALAAARRRRLIDGTTASAGVAAWLALEIAATLLMPPGATATGYLLLCGVLSLAVFPLGAAPLAVAWNRAR